MSGNALPYARKQGVHPFGTAKVLDVEALRRFWLPWLTMDSADSTHLIARNAHITWDQVARRDPEDILARPWASMYASGGLRSFIVNQARMTDYLGDPAANAPSAMAELRDTWAGWLHGDDPLRKLQATALLGTLTATLPLTETEEPDPSQGGAVFQHYCYERAKALRARDLQHGPSGEVMEYLAEHAEEPALRMLALTHLITYAVRVQISPEKTEAWITHAHSQLTELDVHPEWLALLVQNRFQRIVALKYLKEGAHDNAAAALDDAWTSDRKLKSVSGESPLLTHLWAECHRLLLESHTRFHTRRCELESAAPFVAELDLIEPNYPESRAAVGDLFAAKEQWAEAATHYESAAAGGSIHGAVAAFRAFECHRLLGDEDRAQHCLQLLLDLDAGADISQYQI
jgi:hypothetical protein